LSREKNEGFVNPKANGKMKRRFRISPKSAPYVFIAPVIVLFIIFTVYPIIYSLWLSFEKSVGGGYEFAGLDNYIRLFQDPLFYKALGNTFIILIVQVPVQLSLALLIAVALNSQLVKAKPFFRVSFFLPAVTTLVAASMVFILLFDTNYGFFNYILSLFGIDNVGWLENSFWAKISLMTVMTWRWTGYNMVIFLAGLQNIPSDLYEAADIDGAGRIKKFFLITIPQLKPIFLFTVVFSTIGTLQLFDEPYTMTNGGPDNGLLTITLYLYKKGFEDFDFGYASDIGYILVIMIVILSWIQMKIAGDEE